MQTKRCMTIAMMWMVFSFGLGNLCFGQTYWKKTYPAAYDNDLIAIQPTLDCNFLIAGSTLLYGAEAWDGWLLKIKPNGDTLWTKTYGGTNDDYFYAIQPISDGNFLIAGNTNSYGTGHDGWLLKINPDGDTLWTKTYGGTSNDYFSAIQPTTDGNFLIVGFTYLGAEGRDIWLIKIKPNGDTLWTKTYGGTSDDNFSAIQPASDGNFLIAGYTSGDGWLLEIKPNGDTLWTKTYGGAGMDEFYAIQPTPDGNFLIAGRMSDDGWLLKIKPNGDTLWTKTYGGASDDNFSTIQPASDGDFLIVGTKISDSIGYADGWLLKIKPNGDTLWTKTYGRAGGQDFFYAIQPTTDGNFLILGSEYDTAFSGNVVLCIIADQYAYKDSLFNYKIPVYSIDTLNYGYVPLRIPPSMKVSPGGTVSWTPKTDSVYMDHAEFLVMNDVGKKDTLTFNIFVNYNPSISVKPSRMNKIESKPFGINAVSSSGKIKFSMPSFVKSLNIYDMSGRLVGKAAPVMSGSDACVIWPSASSSGSAIPTGRYLAKASAGKNTAVKPFLLVR